MESTRAPFLLRKWHQIKKTFFTRFDHEKLMRLRYEEKFGCQPDLEHPQTFNEKVIWLMLFSDTSAWTELADKFRVRDYVERRGLGHILNQLYGVWESVEQIDFDTLPEEFVLKANNGYGDAIIVRDKSTADLKAIRQKLKRSMQRRFGRKTGERHYLGIEPRIIAERLLPPNPVCNSLIDYKFFCIGGEPQCCQVCYNRISSHESTYRLYEAHTWENLSYHLTGETECAASVMEIPAPESHAQMLDITRKLAAGFPEVRVDLYEVDGRPVFGEMTFTASSGVSQRFTPEFQRKLGQDIRLSSGLHKRRSDPPRDSAQPCPRL